MPLVNACGFRAASSGSGDFVVASELTGFYTPAQCINPPITDGGVYSYRAESDDKTEHEEGSGVYTAGTTTLARTTIHSSSNAGVAVNFSAAPKVALTVYSQDIITNGKAVAMALRTQLL